MIWSCGRNSSHISMIIDSKNLGTEQIGQHLVDVDMVVSGRGSPWRSTVDLCGGLVKPVGKSGVCESRGNFLHFTGPAPALRHRQSGRPIAQAFECGLRELPLLEQEFFDSLLPGNSTNGEEQRTRSLRPGAIGHL